MKTATITDFRNNIKGHLDHIEKDQDILILSRPKSAGFVVLTLENYERLEETAYLLSTEANAERLMKGINQAQNGKLIEKPNL